MTDNVFWVLSLDVKDGELQNFKALMNEMIEATRKETGALNYEWFISEDEASIQIYERYADTDALMVHVGNFGANFAERFLGCVTPSSFVVFGNVSDQAREALAGLGAVHVSQIGGFIR